MHKHQPETCAACVQRETVALCPKRKAIQFSQMNTLPHFKDLKNSLPNPDLCKIVENGVNGALMLSNIGGKEVNTEMEFKIWHFMYLGIMGRGRIGIPYFKIANNF